MGGRGGGAGRQAETGKGWAVVVGEFLRAKVPRSKQI